MALTIRPAVREDAALILRFITDLAIYEKAEHEVKTDVAGIETSLFGEGSTAHGLICELNGEPIGYAVYFFNLLDLAGQARPVPGRPLRHPGATRRRRG